MPKISEEEVQRIAKLARLGVTDEEVTAATHDLGNVLENFAQIQSIETKDVPMATDTSGLTNITREDEAAAEVLASHEELLERAPDTKDRQLKVKAVFK